MKPDIAVQNYTFEIRKIDFVPMNFFDILYSIFFQLNINDPQKYNVVTTVLTLL